MTNPKNVGKEFRDLSKSNKSTPFLYVIEYDDNPRDFSARPTIYGAYWSDHGPDPVNQIAIELWPAFGSPKYRDDEDNVDGSKTLPGKCYQGSACLDVGSRFLSLSVRRVESYGELRFFQSSLLKKVVASRGVLVQADEDKGDWIRRAEEAGIILGQEQAEAAAAPAASTSSTSTGIHSAAAAISKNPEPPQDTKLPPKKKQKEGSKKPKQLVVFEGQLEDGTQVRSVHATAKEAAKAAWQFCGDHELEPFGDEWYTDTARYGEQSCYNVMVTKEGEDWDPEDMFVGYITRHAQKVVLAGNGNEMRIYKENAND
jgi:hypothetical protein